ncbi:hypothetical protein L596_001991 [Steinernema carpocapsae]|uniref:Uncharacterized protein n=1 Tax=Steinernema carpocapsae TaxID=34508 RepID=A0A4U8UN48_STECR|nr:hypothetical protein L596_001991 [Steinernema carpocapsae]
MSSRILIKPHPFNLLTREQLVTLHPDLLSYAVYRSIEGVRVDDAGLCSSEPVYVRAWSFLTEEEQMLYTGRISFPLSRQPKGVASSTALQEVNTGPGSGATSAFMDVVSHDVRDLAVTGAALKLRKESQKPESGFASQTSSDTEAMQEGSTQEAPQQHPQKHSQQN